MLYTFIIGAFGNNITPFLNFFEEIFLLAGFNRFYLALVRLSLFIVVDADEDQGAGVVTDGGWIVLLMNLRQSGFSVFVPLELDDQSRDCW